MIKGDGWKYPGAQVYTQSNVSMKFEVFSGNGFRDTHDTNLFFSYGRTYIRTDGRTEVRTDGRTKANLYAPPP